MVYDYKKEYLNKVCEGHAKYEQEIVVAKKMFDLLNEKYDSVDDLIKNNGTLQEFLKKNNLSTAISHFNTYGNPLNEEDYIKIIENLKTIEKNKKQFDASNIKTTDIDDKQYNSLKIDGKDHYIDNSDSTVTITEQMETMQPDNTEFQTVDPEKNAENMFKNIESKQEGINFVHLYEINTSSLSEEEKELYDAAMNYSVDNKQQIRIDLNKHIMIDEDENIMRITKEDDEIKIVNDTDGADMEKGIENTKTYQKTLTPSTSTIYSN